MTVRVLLTGMSGTGKSTLARELAARGYRAVDADEAGLSEVVEVGEGELTGIGGGRDWVWREDRVGEILSTQEGELLFLAGCSPNQGSFYPCFDHIVLLTAPQKVIAERLATRSHGFGTRPDEVERTLALQQQVEPLLRARADLELDTTAPVEEVVRRILDHVRR